MSNAYRDPVHAAQSHYDRLEREAQNATYVLRLEDDLKMPIEVDGTLFDVATDITLIRHGETGSIEIHSLSVSDDLYVHLPEHCDLVKLDSQHYQHNFKTKYQRLVNAIELAALTKAKVSTNWEMEDV